MNEFETKRASLEDKYANAPEQVTKEDLESYESFYALKTYFWNNQEKTKVVLGDYEVTHTFRRGISSNSGKSKSPTQHKFIIKNLTNDEQWEDGLIIKEHNRRSRFGSVEKYEREMRDTSNSPNWKPGPTKEAIKGSVLELANRLHLPIGLLLDQLAKAKVNITNEDDLFSESDQAQYLEYLKASHKEVARAKLTRERSGATNLVRNG